MRQRRVGTGRIAGLLAAALAAVAGWPSSASSPRPAVPAGTDPGGVVIALLGPGLDYTRLELAGRLARDGEGDPIGRDFVAGDNRPYEAPEAGRPQAGTRAALVLAGLAPGARLLAVKEHPADPAAIGRMMSFVAQSPARIAVWPDGAPTRRDWAILPEAARRFADRLLIVPAPTDLKALTALPRLANLLIVAAAPRPGNAKLPVATTLIVLAPGAVPQAEAGNGGDGADAIASLRVAALAARVLAARPDLDAAALAGVIVARARRASDGSLHLAIGDEPPAGR